jgi:ribonuclease VapC
MTYVDASAMVAVLCREDGVARIAAAMERAERLFTTSVGLFETTLAIVRKKAMSHEEAEREVAAFTRAAEIAIVAVDADLWRLALAAHARFGKGRHAARLNLGDCFAYAAAKARGAAILFVGDDFAQTDLPDALHGA